MKRLLILATIAVLTMGVAACTREKPAEPTTVAVKEVTPAPGPITTPGSGAATTPIAPTTPGLADTPIPVPTTISTPTLVITSTVAPLPTNTPAPTSAPSAPGTYTVQWGDWLNKIAQKTGVSAAAILAANPGLNPNLIYPGQVLQIPSPGSTVPPPVATSSPPPSNPGTYTVQRGDWFYAIARRFGVSVPTLLAANPGINPNFVFPGQVLRIPGGETPPGTTPPAGTGNSYKVQPGDTLFSIALRFRTTTYAIQIANNLANPNFIYPGQVLTIPQ